MNAQKSGLTHEFCAIWADSSHLIGYPRILRDLWGVLIAEAIRGSNTGYSIGLFKKILPSHWLSVFDRSERSQAFSNEGSGQCFAALSTKFLLLLIAT
jgi:hypothetical protein